MLTELKRCNSIGNIAGIVFLISIMAEKNKISKNEIRNRCALENDIIINCSGAIAFFEYLKLVNTTSDVVIPLPELNFLAHQNNEIVINQLAAMCINNLIIDGVFDNDVTSFDIEREHFSVRKSAFPLEYAAIRNFLTMVNVFDKEKDEEICINKDYELIWAKQLQNRKRKITIKQLLKQQIDQNKRGLEAEEFVLKLEKERLPKMARKIKRISDIDAAAGYDIISYENNTSKHYDRFIEVKCYMGTPHFFWSENEVEVAKIKTEKYVLCLVDYTRIGETKYRPEFIRNPYKTIFDSTEWLVNTSSYIIKKI